MMFAHLRKPSGSRLVWEQPPQWRHSSLSILLAALSLGTALPVSAATWTVHTQPTRLVNGAPILFQVKSPAKLESLTGTWLDHKLTFSYDATTKTWFTLAGAAIDTPPGKYTLELTGEPTAAKTPLTFK